MTIHAPLSASDAALAASMLGMGEAAREASARIANAGAVKRTSALKAMADRIRMSEPDILAANQKDMAAARAKGLSGAMLDRLELTAKRVAEMARGVEDVAA